MFIFDRGTGAQQFRGLVLSEIHRRLPRRYKFEFSFVGNDRRLSQKSGTRRENRNAPDSPDLSPIIPDDRGYLRFRVFISRQNLGRSGNSKIPDRLGFSRHMKTRLNELSSAPRLFTKLMKPCYAHLRCQGHIVSGYIDDTYLQQQLFNDALNSPNGCKSLFTSLGLLIHPEKSLNIPSQIATVLGFIINSLDMTISLTTEKKTSLLELCHKTMQSNQITIRDLARLIGKLVFSFPGVAYGPLFYRDLEMSKTEALKLKRGNYDSTMVLSDDMKTELQWWVDNLETATSPISNGNPDIVIDTDASLIGWGAVCNAVTAQGSFTPSDIYYAGGNINVLELLAVKYRLQSLASIIKNRHILVRCDNSTAVSYISNMGGTHSRLRNAMAKEIWLWTMTQGVWITITHIPGKLNKQADFGSRIFLFF